MKLKIKVTEWGYGFFPGGDPRRVNPDSEGTTPEEVENHRLACDAWGRGEQHSRPDWEGYILTTCQFGLGSYSWDEEMWPWEWVRYVAWPSLCNRVYRRWGLDVHAWQRRALKWVRTVLER
jgi:hypothetical protein